MLKQRTFKMFWWERERERERLTFQIPQLIVKGRVHRYFSWIFKSRWQRFCLPLWGFHRKGKSPLPYWWRKKKNPNTFKHLVGWKSSTGLVSRPDQMYEAMSSGPWGSPQGWKFDGGGVVADLIAIATTPLLPDFQICGVPFQPDDMAPWAIFGWAPLF